MRKIIIALLMFFGFATANSQVTFKPGIHTGLNISKIADTELKLKPDFYIGVYGALKLSRFYTFQPEISYSRQGGKGEADLRQLDQNFSITYAPKKTNVTLEYFSATTINKFNFGKTYFLLGPYVDILIGDDFKVEGGAESYEIARGADIDLGLTGGFGYDFSKNFAFEARVKKGFIDAVELESNYGARTTNLVFQFGVAYTFGKK